MTEQKEREFKCYVVRIIDEFTLLINIGTDDNEPYFKSSLDELATRVGDKIKILAPGPMIIDPITNEELGYFDKTKEVLEIVELLPKMAICKNIKREKQTSSVLNVFATQTTETTEALPINVDKDEIDTIEFASAPVKVGDPVQFL